MTALIAWSIRVVILLLLMGGVAYMHRITSVLQQEVADRQRLLERTPSDALYAATARSELFSHMPRIEDIRKYVVSHDDIVEVVGVIEGEGARHGVTVHVPAIREDDAEEGLGQPALASELLENIRIDVVATGDPVRLAQFLHSLEHLPYLMHVRPWSLVTDGLPRAQGLAAPVPDEEGLNNRGDGIEGRLELRVIISVEARR